MNGLRFKALTAFAAFSTGVLSHLKRLRLRNSAFVLMYHRVLPSVRDENIFVQPGMYVSQDTFRQQVAYIADNFNVIPLTELVGRTRAGRNIGGCCAITFDDGWLDNYTAAFPIFKEFQLPVTIFLVSGYIGTNRLFWPEELCSYLENIFERIHRTEIPAIDDLLKNATTTGDKEAFFNRAIEVLKRYLPDDRRAILGKLKAISSVTPERQLLMNWDEAAEMGESNLVSFGAHTVNHEILDQVSPESAEYEISSSCSEIEEHLGTRVNLFAYPNGNFNQAIQEILKRNSLQAAVTTRRGLMAASSDIFEIPRIGMHEDVSNTIPLFLARIIIKRF
jgi:peptidoglycan/xylan/chitin deacetylase (PgdA/CDA1 family)